MHVITYYQSYKKFMEREKRNLNKYSTGKFTFKDLKKNPEA